MAAAFRGTCEYTVQLCYPGLNLQMHTLFAHTECFRNGLVRELKERQRKLSRHSMTSKTHGPHRRNNKSEYQECTCKMDKSWNRGMLNKFESRKIFVAGYQCDNSDFDFCIAEPSELPVIKICSDEGRDDCQQLKPKGTEASFGTTVISATIIFITSISILFSRVTVIVLVLVLRVVFFHTMLCVGILHYQQVLCDSEVTTREGNELVVQKENFVVEEIKEVN